MIKFIKHHQKKFLALFTVGLMLTFTASFGNFGPTAQNPVVAHIGDEAIKLQEQITSRRQWSILSRIGITHIPGMQEDQALPASMLLTYDPFRLMRGGRQELVAMQRVVEQINQDPDVFLLLQKEAKQMGMTASADGVQELMRNQNRLTETSSPEEVQETQQAFASLLLAQAAYRRASSVLKVPAPERLNAMATFEQTITLKYIAYNGDEFKTAVTAPTPDQLKQQFEKYKNFLADQPDESNPAGYGYMIPSRVKLEFLSIQRADLHEAVKQSKSAKDWEFAARIQYNRNPTEYPTTKPSDLPVGVAAPTTVPTTGPTTRPHGFAEYQEQITNQLIDEAEYKLLDDVQNKIATTLQADWSAYRAAVSPTTKPTTQPAEGPMTSLGVPYGSDQYLPKLALAIQKEFKVLPKVDRFAKDWLAAKDISALPGYGSAILENPDPRGQSLSLSEYVMGYLDGFGHQSSASDQAPTLSVLSPSPAMSDMSRNVHYFRVIGDDPAHAIDDMAPVAPQVEADWRQATALSKARAEIDKLAATTAASNLDAAAVTVGRKVSLTGPISQRGVAPTPELSLKLSSQIALIKTAFDLLKRGSSDVESGKATAVVELPLENKVLLVSPATIKPQWQADSAYKNESSINQELNQLAEQQFRSLWFNSKEIQKRTNYRPEEKKKDPTAG